MDKTRHFLILHYPTQAQLNHLCLYYVSYFAEGCETAPTRKVSRPITATVCYKYILYGTHDWPNGTLMHYLSLLNTQTYIWGEWILLCLSVDYFKMYNVRWKVSNAMNRNCLNIYMISFSSEPLYMQLTYFWHIYSTMQAVEM